MRLRAVFKCPFCGGVIRNEGLRIGQPAVTCPNCSRQLQSARWQLHLSGLIALGLTVAVCRIALNLGGVRLLAATGMLWFPVYVVWDFIFLRILPPRFEAYVPEDTSSTGKTSR